MKWEKDVRYFATKSELPVVKSVCPADGNTERERMKDLHGSEPKRGRREKAEKKMKIGSPIKTEVDCINLD